MRGVSWVVVLSSVVWLVAGMLGFRPSDVHLPQMSDQQLSGTAAARLPQPATPRYSTVPYSEVYPLLEALETVAGLDRVEAVLSMDSILPGVEPQDLELVARDGFKTYVFKPLADGSLRLPVRKDWRDEGLLLESNQPRLSNGAATTALSLTMSFAAPPSAEIDYAWLWESVQQMKTSMKVLPGNVTPEQRPVKGLVVKFEEGSSGGITIKTEGEPESYLADPDGILRLPIEERLRETNPVVVFSDIDVLLGPWVP